MITLNPAARSCLPRPIVNLCWKLWLSLKFARHFIFWWSGQSSRYSCSEDKWMPHFQVDLWQQLCTQHAQRWLAYWWRWDCFGGEVFYSFFQSFSVLALSFQLTWICNTIQVFTVLCCIKLSWNFQWQIWLLCYTFPLCGWWMNFVFALLYARYGTWVLNHTSDSVSCLLTRV